MQSVNSLRDIGHNKRIFFNRWDPDEMAYDVLFDIQSLNFRYKRTFISNTIIKYFVEKKLPFWFRPRTRPHPSFAFLCTRLFLKRGLL